MPASVHRAIVPAAPKSPSSGCAVMTRIRAMSASSSTPAILDGPIERPALVKGPGCSGPGWLPGARWRAVAADDLPVEALYLAGAVGVDGQGPAQLVQDHVVVPPAVVLEVGEAGAAAVGAVGDVVGLAAGRRLVTAPGILAGLIPQRDQPPQVTPDLVALPDGAAARCAASRARYTATDRSCTPESATRWHRSAKVTWTRALTGCPARLGSRSEASRRRIASASASW